MKSVSMTTVKYDLIALGLVLQFAQRKEYIQSVPQSPKLDVSNTNPRPAFTIDEWHTLLKASEGRIKAVADNKRLVWQREQLHDYMVFSVHTGLRVNEVLSVKVLDCKIEKMKKKNGRLLVIKNVVGKNDVREVIGLIGAVRTYERVVKRNKLNPGDLLLPCFLLL